MVYTFEITTPLNTPINSPVITKLPISRGVIRYWHILFPEGNWCECPIRIKKGGNAILPMNPDSQMKGNGPPFTSEEFIYISNPPWELQAYTWNVDLKNQHTIYLGITIMPLWSLLPYSNQLLDLLANEEVRLII